MFGIVLFVCKKIINLQFNTNVIKYEVNYMKYTSYKWAGGIINNLIKENRKRCKLTQRELAAKVDVTERTIISLESAKYKPSIILAYKLARVFDTDIETLFCLKEYLENEEKE